MMIMNKIYHSKKINLNYKIKHDFLDNQVVVFEDGVNYSTYEMSKIQGLSNDSMINIHAVKKIFQGVIV